MGEHQNLLQEQENQIRAAEKGINGKNFIEEENKNLLQLNPDLLQSMHYSPYSKHFKILSRYTFKNVLIFSFVICLSVCIALAILTIWQSWLVCFGETSVERMKSGQNRADCKRRKIAYKSPYNFGVKKNWQFLLGFDDFSSFCWNVLLPSRARGHFVAENLRFVEQLDEERLL